MRKLAIALVAAITVGAALPAAAQVGFYAGPSGIGVGVGSHQRTTNRGGAHAPDRPAYAKISSAVEGSSVSPRSTLNTAPTVTSWA